MDDWTAPYRSNHNGMVLEKLYLAKLVMSRSKKLLLLLLPLWTLIWFLYSIFALWPLPLVELIRLPPLIFVVHFVTIIIFLGLIALYSNHLYMNSQFSAHSKTNWLIGFVFTLGFVMVIYWRKYIQ